MDCAKERGSGFIVAGRDSPVMLKFFKEVLDQMTCFVEHLVIAALGFSVGFWRDHRLDSGGLKPVDHPFIGIITFVREQYIGLYFADQNVRAVQITGLSGRQVKARRIAQRVAKRMDFCAQPTF